MSFDDRERGRIGADLLVLLAVHLDPARATRVAALADQVNRFRMPEALSQSLKPLVHFTEQRLVHADSAIRRTIARPWNRMKRGRRHGGGTP